MFCSQRETEYGIWGTGKATTQEIGKQRATVLEGSFGNEKNHYLLQKVKAANQANEIIWIFFGIMTCNAVQIAKRISGRRKRKSAA